MHKFSFSDSFPKLFPIVSSIGTFNYNLSLFLCDLLLPLVPNYYSCKAKDTFSFVSQIKNANLSNFIFNSKFHNQIDGVAMGSLLAPVLANIFMGFHKSKWLNEYNLNKPKFYLRYVHDILAAFDNEQDSLNFLNNRHPNIKFTIEKQINHSIAFLDVFISGVDNQNFTNLCLKHITNQPIHDFFFI